MAIKLTHSAAVADAIASVRMEGMAVDAKYQPVLDRLAQGQISAAQAKRAIIESVRAPKRTAAPARKQAAVAR